MIWKFDKIKPKNNFLHLKLRISLFPLIDLALVRSSDTVA